MASRRWDSRELIRSVIGVFESVVEMTKTVPVSRSKVSAVLADLFDVFGVASWGELDAVVRGGSFDNWEIGEILPVFEAWAACGFGFSEWVEEDEPFQPGSEAEKMRLSVNARRAQLRLRHGNRMVRSIKELGRIAQVAINMNR